MSGLAHFAGSSRTSPEVREAPNSDYGRVGWARRFRETDVSEYWIGTAASVRLDVGRADHLAPLFGVLGDELAELSGRHRQWNAAQVCEPLLDLRIGEAG